jgi:hypothetical protein
VDNQARPPSIDLSRQSNAKVEPNQPIIRDEILRISQTVTSLGHIKFSKRGETFDANFTNCQFRSTDSAPPKAQFTPQNSQYVPNSLNFSQLLLNTPQRIDVVKDKKLCTKESRRAHQFNANPVQLGNEGTGFGNCRKNLTTQNYD